MIHTFLLKVLDIPWNIHMLRTYVLFCSGTGKFYPYLSGLFHWYRDNLTTTMMQVKRSFLLIWVNESYKFTKNLLLLPKISDADIVFIKTRVHLILSCLVLLGFFCCVFVIFNTLIYFNEYKYSLHTLHFHTIPQGHWANQIQPVLLTVISMYVSGLYWAIQDKA